METREGLPRVARAAWPSFLRGENASAISERLGQGDPLRLRERSALRLREQWVLLEPDRVFYRALGVCADAALLDEPPVDLEAWVALKIDLAIEQLVLGDRVGERAQPDLPSDEECEFPLLTECLMLDPKLVRPATVAFNRLDALPRRAFFELMILGRFPREVIKAGPWDEDDLYAAIQTALATLSLDARADADEAQARITPRRALATLHVGEVSGTKAERHLVAAHRESLARILYEGARIAYWKAPGLALRPLGMDGMPFDPAQGEPDWRTRVGRMVRRSSPQAEGVQLLVQCMDGIRAEQGYALARASLTLVSREEVLFLLGSFLSTTQARTSLRIFERIALTTAVKATRDRAWGELGRTLCSLGRLAEARDAYRKGGQLWRNAMCVFNLCNRRSLSTFWPSPVVKSHDGV